MNNLFLVEDDRWKNADLFSVKVYELILKRNGKFLFDYLLKFFDFCYLAKFRFEGLVLRWFEVYFYGIRIFYRSGFDKVLNVFKEVFYRFNSPVLQTVLVLMLIRENLLEFSHSLLGLYFLLTDQRCKVIISWIKFLTSSFFSWSFINLKKMKKV